MYVLHSFLSEVFVDTEKGSDNSTCGQLSAPCKTLMVAVNRTPNQGTINVKGTQHINNTIKLNKCLTFEGVDDTTILPSNNKVSLFTFEIANVSLNVSFVSLKLKGISLLKTKDTFKHSVTVVIQNCSFEGKGKHDNSYMIKFYSERGSITLHSSNSSFTNMANVLMLKLQHL